MPPGEANVRRESGGQQNKVSHSVAGASPPEPEVSRIPINLVVPSNSLRQMGEDASHVEYLTRTENKLPPIVVHRSMMYIIDGMHRLRAAERRGDTYIDVTFFEGTEDEAFVCSVRANAAHGLPLSLRDRRAAAGRILRSHPSWSDRLIATTVGLSAGAVAALRQRSTEQPKQLNSRVGSDGRSRPNDPVERRLRASRFIGEAPGASLREIAAAAEISIATARDVRQRKGQGHDPVPSGLREPRSHGRRMNEEGRAAQKYVPGLVSRSAESPLRTFQSDPALRYSEKGRALLRMLHTSSLSAETWRVLVNSVPNHVAPAVAQAARICGEQWFRFAEEVERQE